MRVVLKIIDLRSGLLKLGICPSRGVVIKVVWSILLCVKRVYVCDLFTPYIFIKNNQMTFRIWTGVIIGTLL